MPPPPPAAPSEPAAPAAPPAEAPAPEAPPAEAPKPRRRGSPKPWSDDARRHGKPRYGHTLGGSKRPQGGPPWTEGMGNPVTKETSGDVPTVDAHPKATASSGVPLPPPIPGAVELATERALAAVAAEVAAEAEKEAVPSVSVAELEVKIQLAAPLIRRLEVSLKAVEALHPSCTLRRSGRRSSVPSCSTGRRLVRAGQSAAAGLHALHGKMGDMVSPTQADVDGRGGGPRSRMPTPALGPRACDGGEARGLRRGIPARRSDHRRRPHHRRRRRRGPPAMPRVSTSGPRADRARGARRAFGETVAAPAVAAEIKRLSAEKAPPREIPREIKASKRPATQGRWGHTPPAAASNVPPFAAAAVAVAAPGRRCRRAAARAPPRTLVPKRRLRSSAIVRGGSRAASVEDQAADCARAGGGLQPVGRRRRASLLITGEPTVAPKVRAAMKVAAAAEVEARAESFRQATAPSAGRPPMAREDEVSLRLPSEDTTAARPTAASEARRLPTQAEAEGAPHTRTSPRASPSTGRGGGVPPRDC